MPGISRIEGTAAEMRFLRRRLAQLETDVFRILRRLPDLAGTDGSVVDNADQDSGGSVLAEGVLDSALISGGIQLLEVSHGTVASPITVRADFLDPGSSITAGATILAARIDSTRWQVILTKCENIEG
jgi:hypothetical protein